MVYVLSHTGAALMPTERHGKVRRLLRDGLAHVVTRTPFTIRLDYESTEFTQPVTLGVDAGTTHVGMSATTDSREIFSAEVTLRTDIVKLLSQRREARRTRRSRQRYRAPRFDNRRRPEGRLAPSAENRVQTHLKLIERVHSILPITGTVIEVAQFDAQLLKNPDIAGMQCQQGERMGFWNTREYVLCRDGHKCQHCKGKTKDPVLNVHHIESRQTGGDAPNNLITLCETCHKAYHKGEIELNVKRGTSLRDAALMNVMRWELYRRARSLWQNVSLTYGYITKHTRISAGLEKSHRVDARCISGHPMAEPSERWFCMKQTRRHNRQVMKARILKGGRLKRNQAPYLVHGFRLFDKVMLNGTECFIFGRRSSGSFDVRLVDGTKIHAGIGHRKLRFLEASRRFLITLERNGAIPLPTEAGSILAHFS